MDKYIEQNTFNQMGGFVLDTSKCDLFWQVDNMIGGDFVDLLAAYKDTGLTPEEVAALDAENARLRADLERVTAERDSALETAKINAENVSFLQNRIDKSVGFIHYFNLKFGHHMPVEYHERFEQWRGLEDGKC